MKKVVPDDEVQMLERLRRGDAQAYRYVYDRYHIRIYYYVLRYVKIPELTEDIVQDVLLKLWEVREGVKPGLSMQGYLYRICRNHVFKTMKKIAADRVLRERVVQRVGESAAAGTEQQLQWRQYEQLFKTAVDQLSPQRQRVFKLCRMEGKTYEETAAILGISRHTVKEHMKFAIKSIKDYFYTHGDIVLGLLLLSTY